MQTGDALQVTSAIDRTAGIASTKEGVDLAESTRVYEREIRFYREVAPHTPIRVPRVFM